MTTVTTPAMSLTQACEGCGKEFTNLWDSHAVCMECVRARAKAAMSHKCSCGRKARPRTMSNGTGPGARKWVSCDRCLGTIRQIS